MADLVLRAASSELTNALVAITGPSGSGKSYGGLLLAHGLGKKIVVIDTELRPDRRGRLRGRSETYQGKKAGDGSGVTFDFSVIALDPPYSIPRYLQAFDMAWNSGADVVVCDSITHEWTGLLGRVDDLKRQQKNQMAAWQVATPEHERFVAALVSAPSHIIATIRSKMTTAEVEENGRKTFRRVGYQPIQRDGVEYEFEVIFEVDQDHRAICTKANAGYALDLTEFMARPEGSRLSVELGRRLLGWLDGAVPPVDVGKVRSEIEREMRRLAPAIQTQVRALMERADSTDKLVKLAEWVARKLPVSVSQIERAAGIESGGDPFPAYDQEDVSVSGSPGDPCGDAGRSSGSGQGEPETLAAPTTQAALQAASVDPKGGELPPPAPAGETSPSSAAVVADVHGQPAGASSSVTPVDPASPVLPPAEAGGGTAPSEPPQDVRLTREDVLARLNIEMLFPEGGHEDFIDEIVWNDADAADEKHADDKSEKVRLRAKDDHGTTKTYVRWKAAGGICHGKTWVPLTRRQMRVFIASLPVIRSTFDKDPVADALGKIPEGTI